MKTPTKLSMFTAVFLGILLPACSSSDEAAPGSGGRKGTGGMTSSGSGGSGGLSVGSGGAPGSGGAVGTGGDVASTGGSSTGTGGEKGSAETGGTGPAATGGRGGGAVGGTTGTGGAGGSTGAAGASGDNSYNPCPPMGQPCLVMPLGDSITQGTDGSSDGGGYRETLFRLAHAAGKSIKLVGSRSNGPSMVDGVAWPRNHEGYPGYTISRLLSNNLTQNAIKTYKPNIVLLMIGTNDLAAPGATPAGRLVGLVDAILSTDPTVLLFLTQVTPAQTAATCGKGGTCEDLVWFNQGADTYNKAMVGMVAERAAAGKHIRLADMNTPFTSNPMYSTALLHNGIHPNDAGYKKMGETWYGYLGPLLH